MIEMLELFDKNFKAAVTKFLQNIIMNHIFKKGKPQQRHRKSQHINNRQKKNKMDTLKLENRVAEI